MSNRQAPQVRVTSITQLANAIMTMHYGDLMQVAREFRGMCTEDRDVRRLPKTAEDFASMLHDWAEAQANS